MTGWKNPMFKYEIHRPIHGGFSRQSFVSFRGVNFTNLSYTNRPRPEYHSCPIFIHILGSIHPVANYLSTLSIILCSASSLQIVPTDDITRGDEPILTNIFQVGWNHQPVMSCFLESLESLNFSRTVRPESIEDWPTCRTVSWWFLDEGIGRFWTTFFLELVEL